jgi:hypothetical protein
MDAPERPAPLKKLEAHGPGIPVYWYLIWALPVQSAASYGHSEPLDWIPVKVWASRN